ncbi:MAG TPA: TetR family transcriptional regulator [Pseudomonadales bacterium]|jgi:AcrR family transcriptional regulator|nr:TetR family transcriptional regulator [Gammaproteobacteria bacterium]HIL83762.1 TetR family transcriptional regulator [Pseudomonadales bacterium]
MSESTDGQRARNLTTQVSLMEAAEKLIFRHGIHHVAVKDIVREANQKNESALQYHSPRNPDRSAKAISTPTALLLYWR